MWACLQAYRELLCTTPGLGEYISGAILFEETLYQNTTTGSTMVDELNKQGIVPGIHQTRSSLGSWIPCQPWACWSTCHAYVVRQHHLKAQMLGLLTAGSVPRETTVLTSVIFPRAGIKVDKGLVPLPNSNNESWCQGLDGLAQRTAEYYKQVHAWQQHGCVHFIRGCKSSSCLLRNYLPAQRTLSAGRQAVRVGMMQCLGVCW